ncbi:hypothetical protein F511_18716 [Dorcoceras hygrometricum]|uniref:Uncharacterized protein n=1 Tax=Dorcoceras hygrometricum TaxID=472368 RepID=A0A2Z7C123_9LAMI|nr:hypothetical protein F511_18716 [Dorcoceras hygrometricum]
MANIDQSSPKQGKINEVKPQYEEHNKSIYHIRQCNIQSCNAWKGLPRIIGTTTQPTITRQCVIQAQRLSWPPHQNSVGPFRHEDSAGRSQRILQQQGSSNQPKSTALAAPWQLSISYYRFKSKAVKEQKTGPQSRRPTNTATTSRSSIPATPVSKLVSIKSPREYELSATNLAPNGGEKQWQRRK